MEKLNGLIRLDTDTGIFIDYNEKTYKTVGKSKDNTVLNNLKSLGYKENKKTNKGEYGNE